MVNLVQRTRKLQTRLLAIRLGSGAVVLPKEVKQIDLQFASTTSGGHMGPKNFWRNELVRLQYHNPSVRMTVTRKPRSQTPARMLVHFAPADAQPTSSDPSAQDVSEASASASPSRIETINMKNYSNSEIMEALVQLTKAYPVEPTAKDKEEIATLEEQRQRSEVDSARSLEVKAKRKREQELLEQARGELKAQAE